MRYVGYLHKNDVLEGEDLLPEIIAQINERREELKLGREDMLDSIEVTVYDEDVFAAATWNVASIKLNNQSFVPLLHSGSDNGGFRASVTKDDTIIRSIILEHNCEASKDRPFDSVLIKYAYTDF